MLSLRSLAFILCSAIRRSRALSCAALHCFPDATKTMISGKNMLTSDPAAASNSQRFMCSLRRALCASPRSITAQVSVVVGWVNGCVRGVGAGEQRCRLVAG